MAERGFEEVLATNLYHDPVFERKAAKVLPGEYYFTRDDMVLVTVLGSCVAACIRDRQTGLGGMNHFMLPEGGAGMGGVVSAPMRYGSYAMEVLINELLKHGARRASLEAKVFGGGAVLRGISAGNVGERNGAFVLDYLTTEGISVAAQDLYDVYPRKVHFLPRTGQVFVKKLKDLKNGTIVQREQDYAKRLKRAPVAGDVELFT